MKAGCSTHIFIYLVFLFLGHHPTQFPSGGGWEESHDPGPATQSTPSPLATVIGS